MFCWKYAASSGWQIPIVSKHLRSAGMHCSCSKVLHTKLWLHFMRECGKYVVFCGRLAILRQLLLDHITVWILYFATVKSNRVRRLRRSLAWSLCRGRSVWEAWICGWFQSHFINCIEQANRWAMDKGLTCMTSLLVTFMISLQLWADQERPSTFISKCLSWTSEMSLEITAIWVLLWLVMKTLKELWAMQINEWNISQLWAARFCCQASVRKYSSSGCVSCALWNVQWCWKGHEENGQGKLNNIHWPYQTSLVPIFFQCLDLLDTTGDKNAPDIKKQKK